MKAYHNSVVLRNDGEDPSTFKLDLNAGITEQVTVRINSTQALAVIFDVDDVGTANPLTTDNNGNYAFKAADNIYDIIVSEGTANEVKLEKVEIAEIPTAPILINDLSQAYTFPSRLLMQDSLIAFPDGKKLAWQGYDAESDGGNNWGIVKTGAHTDDGGEFFTLAGGKYVQANLKGKKINVAKFGATVALTNTARRTAIQNALNLTKTYPSASFVGSPTIYFPDGEYEIDASLNIVTFSASMICDKGGAFTSGAKIIMEDGNYDPVLVVNALNPVNVSGFKADNMKFEGASRTLTPVIVQLGDDTNVGVDIDASFSCCTFLKGVDAINIFGRGLKVYDCDFLQINDAGISINWPSGYIPDPAVDQTPEGGFRGYRIENNRTHASSGHLVVSDSVLNAENVAGLLVTDNFSDTFAGLFDGSCVNSTFSGNMLINANNIRCIQVDTVHNTTFDNNTFTGVNGSNDWDTQIFFVCRSASSEIKHVTLSNNKVISGEKEVFRLDGSWDDVVIDGNLFKDVTLDNALGVTDYPIVRLFSDGAGLQFINNTVDIPAMTNQPPAVSLSGRLAANNTGAVFDGNVLPSYVQETDFSPFYQDKAANGDFGVYVGDGSDPKVIPILGAGRACIVSVKTNLGGNMGDTFMALSGTGVVGPGVKWDGLTNFEASLQYNLNNVEYNYAILK